MISSLFQYQGNKQTLWNLKKKERQLYDSLLNELLCGRRDESSMYRTSHQMEMLEPEMEEVILYDTSGPSLYGQSNSSQGFEYHQSRETSFIQHYSG